MGRNLLKGSNTASVGRNLLKVGVQSTDHKAADTASSQERAQAMAQESRVGGFSVGAEDQKWEGSYGNYSSKVKEEIGRPRNLLQAVGNALTPAGIKDARGRDFIRENMGDPELEKKLTANMKFGIDDVIKGLDVPLQFVRGNLAGRSFGVSEKAEEFLPEGVQNVLKPRSTTSDVSFRIGQLLGLGPAVKYILTKGPLVAVSKLEPITKIGVLGKNMLKGGMSLGGYSVLSEWGGKDLMENLKRLVFSGVQGAGMGMFFGAVNGITGDLLSKTGIKDSYTHLTALALRLGANQMVTGGPAYQRYIKGEESLPGLIYEVGLGVMFSLSGNPLKVEAEFNKSVKRHYKLKNMTADALAKKLASFGDWKKVPLDLKWAYIMKVSGGKIKPSDQNIGAADGIVEQFMDKSHPKEASKVRFLKSFIKDMEQQVEGVAEAMGVEKPSKRGIKYKQDGNEYYHSMEATMPKGYKAQETRLENEMASGRDVGQLKRKARDKGLRYTTPAGNTSNYQLNKYLKQTRGITVKDLNKLPKAEIEAIMKDFDGIVTNEQTGKARIPESKEILPLEFFDWVNQKGNVFDWMQSARMPIRPIYDMIKPAYENYMAGRSAKLTELNQIYNKRIKRGSAEDIALAKYADGKIKIDKVPAGIRDIAEARKIFYDRYADELMNRGLLDPKKVFNKDGTRKPYYHRIFDSALHQIVNLGWAMEDVYLPGNLPMASALKKRKGAKGYEYSAMDSDTRYVYGMEKYLNMQQSVDASIKYAKLLKGTRKNMANVYIRAMRGQPAHFDNMVREQLDAGVNWVGDKLGNKRMKNWKAPVYPISHVTSPIARFYYWRYVGLAMDTAMKNSIQWHHATARYGIENTARAARMQFTPEGKALIKESKIHRESIQRGQHFIEEIGQSQKLSKIEENSYWIWSKFDTNNRNISGLAGYLEARGKGASHPKAIEAMRVASHETQYGYTKADSLLVDMANPMARFVMFKKWPMAKVEMIRSWARSGNSDAIFNLALQEYVIYRAAQSAGIDIGNYFGGVWQLAARGLESPANLLPFVKEAVNIYKMFGTGREAEKAKEQVIRSWQGLGNRYLGKVVEFGRAWLNDWEVREHNGKLKYKSTPREEATKLIAKPLTQSKRQAKNKRMLEIGDKIKGIRKNIVQKVMAGDIEAAQQLNLEMMTRYGDEYTQEFGKKLKPVTMRDVKSSYISAETPLPERIRKGMPGRGIKVPLGKTFKGKKKGTNLFRAVRGY